jgi:hypothetical protein
MSGGASSSAPDEKVVKDDLDKFVFYEDGVAKGVCRNSLLYGDTANRDFVTLERIKIETRLITEMFTNVMGECEN